MDSIREQMDLAEDISNAMAQPLGGEGLDDVSHRLTLIPSVPLPHSSPLFRCDRMSCWLSWSSWNRRSWTASSWMWVPISSWTPPLSPRASPCSKRRRKTRRTSWPSSEPRWPCNSPHRSFPLCSIRPISCVSFLFLFFCKTPFCFPDSLFLSCTHTHTHTHLLLLHRLIHVLQLLTMTLKRQQLLRVDSFSPVISGFRLSFPFLNPLLTPANVSP